MGNVSAYNRLSKLYPEVTQCSYTADCDHVSGFELGFFDTGIHGHSSTT